MGKNKAIKTDALLKQNMNTSFYLDNSGVNTQNSYRKSDNKPYLSTANLDEQNLYI